MIRIEFESVTELRDLVSVETIELVNENNKLKDDLRLAQRNSTSFSRGLVDFLINHDEAELVRMFVRSRFPNDKINQIKLLKQTMGSGLNDTKEFIEGTINYL